MTYEIHICDVKYILGAYVAYLSNWYLEDSLVKSPSRQFLYLQGISASRTYGILPVYGNHNWKIAHKLHKQRGRKLLSLLLLSVLNSGNVYGGVGGGGWSSKGGVGTVGQSVGGGMAPWAAPLRWFFHCACALNRKVGKFILHNPMTDLAWYILPYTNRRSHKDWLLWIMFSLVCFFFWAI